MRRRVAGLVCAVLVASLGFAPSQAAMVDGGDIQVLPRHPQQVPYPAELNAATPDYLMHDVTDYGYDGHSHLTILRASDGQVVWSGVEPSADTVAYSASLAGHYFVEKIADANHEPVGVRFFDIETHTLAGAVAIPDRESLFAIGDGWILTTHLTSGAPGSEIVVHRLDGTTSELTDTHVSQSPYVVGVDGDTAWVDNGYDSTVYRVNLGAGTDAVLSPPDGTRWHQVQVGPTKYFDIDNHYGGHITVTAVDRTTGAATTTDLVVDGGASQLFLMTRGTGLAAYKPPVSQVDGTLSSVDLAAGALGPIIEDHLSDVKQMAPGKIALVAVPGPPGNIEIESGAGPSALITLPPRSEQAWRIVLDGDLRATWLDNTTWRIDPSAADPTWSQTPWTDHQRVTTSSGTVLVNDLDDNYQPTDHWHLSWPGGQRDLTGWGMRLGHGGKLLVRQVVEGGEATVVERVPTGQVVANISSGVVVADGSWIWTSPATTTLHGIDVDHPENPARTYALSGSSAGVLVDVRGRWAMVANAGWTVIDTLGVVAPWTVPDNPNQTNGEPHLPLLGDGFVFWSKYRISGQYDPAGYVSDLTASHTTKQVVDPEDGQSPNAYAVNESGSPAIAFTNSWGFPKIARLPWLGQAPTIDDHTAPTTSFKALPTFSMSSPVAVSWTAADSQSAVAGTDVRVRTAPWDGYFSPTSQFVTGTAASKASRPVPLGSTACFSARSSDMAGNRAMWTGERCTAVPADDTAASKSAGWSRTTSSAYYRGSALLSKTNGSRLTVTNVRAKRIALLVSTGAANGKIEVYWRGAALGSWSLASTTTVHRKLISIRTLSAVTSGTLVVKVITSGKPVRIDGFAFSQG